MQLSKHSLALATAAALLAAGPAHAQLALTPAGTADGFTLSTFASGFPNSSSIGPAGVAFVNGGELVADFLGNVRFFPTDADGQSASTATVGQNYGLANAWGLAQLNGAIYMAQQLNGDVVQINPNGTFNQVIVGGINQATGLLADPFNDSLYVSSAVFGNGTVYNVNPVTKTKTPFVNFHLDGLTLSADGSVLYGAGDQGADEGHILGSVLRPARRSLIPVSFPAGRTARRSAPGHWPATCPSTPTAARCTRSTWRRTRRRQSPPAVRAATS